MLAGERLKLDSKDCLSIPERFSVGKFPLDQIISILRVFNVLASVISQSLYERHQSVNFYDSMMRENQNSIGILQDQSQKIQG